jgi:hypothetical protein
VGAGSRCVIIAPALLAAAALAAIVVAPAAAQRGLPEGAPQAKAGVPATAAIGRIVLSPAPDQPFSPTVPWLAHRPDGTLVDCTGTQTSCFQEAENEAFAKDWSLDVRVPPAIRSPPILTAPGHGSRVAISRTTAATTP